MGGSKLGDRSPREVFDELAAKADGADALDEFAGALSLLLESGTWTALRTEVQSSIAKYLLASTLTGAGIEVGVPCRADGHGLRDHVEYIDNWVLLRLRMTDSEDPIVLQHLQGKEVEMYRDDPEALRTWVRELGPILFILAGVGLIYWDKDYSDLDYTLSRTAIMLPVHRLKHYIDRNRNCLIPLTNVKPARSKLKRDEVGGLVAAFAVRHTGCAAPQTPLSRS